MCCFASYLYTSLSLIWISQCLLTQFTIHVLTSLCLSCLMGTTHSVGHACVCRWIKHTRGWTYSLLQIVLLLLLLLWVTRVRFVVCVSSCTSCTKSKFACTWCIKNHRCTHQADEFCRKDVLITGSNVSSPAASAWPYVQAVEVTESSLASSSDYIPNVLACLV